MDTPAESAGTAAVPVNEDEDEDKDVSAAAAEEVDEDEDEDEEDGEEAVVRTRRAAFWDMAVAAVSPIHARPASGFDLNMSNLTAHNAVPSSET